MKWCSVNSLVFLVTAGNDDTVLFLSMETYTKHEIVSVKCIVFISHCKLYLILVHFIFLLTLLFAIVYIFKTYF